MSDGDNCRIKAGEFGLYIHHDCNGHKYDSQPEYIPGTFASRDPKAARFCEVSA
jgi:hypothetical protein